MHSSAVRHTVRLRLTLVGMFPEIWRDVVVDRDLTLADLRGIIHAVFEGQSCGHHLFTDAPDSPGWSRTRRRWGDRWTMIDFRDPTVIDETTARIGRVLRDALPLYYGHTCEGGWLVEVEAHEDDLAAAAAPPALVTGGDRATPFACSRGAYEHNVLAGMLADLDHPLRETLLSRLENAAGPWSRYDPAAFDLAEAQRRVGAIGVGGAPPRQRVGGPLGRIAERLPRAARAGFQRHLAAAALDLPTVVTTDDAQAATREFAWVVSRAADGGIPMTDGTPDPAVVQAGIDALDCDEKRMLRLVAFAKRGRLLYARGGTLRANKRSAAAAANPGTLWALLARELVPTIARPMSGDLFLLAIADGSLADPAIGTRRSAAALVLIEHGSVAGRCGDAYDDYCDQSCDCPSDGSGTWHDVVAQAIRDAAHEAAHDEAVPVAARYADIAARGLGFAPEWFETASSYAVTTQTRRDAPADEAALLAEVGDLVELLSMFGLEHADDGAWIVPPTLRELARESLQRAAYYSGF